MNQLYQSNNLINEAKVSVRAAGGIDDTYIIGNVNSVFGIAKTLSLSNVFSFYTVLVLICLLYLLAT